MVTQNEGKAHISSVTRAQQAPAVCQNILENIGNTPLVRLNRIAELADCHAEIYAKLEYLNPFASVKDRIAESMIRRAEEQGELRAGGRIIEATAGNTGIGIACIGSLRGYEVILTMPDNMSLERILLLSHFGAKIVLTPSEEGMAGTLAKARQMVKEDPEAVMLDQFRNQANIDIHYQTTAQEIWDAMGDKVDAFVAGVGTGGTLEGVRRRLRECRPEIDIYAVEPAQSPALSGGIPHTHQIQGIGSNVSPELLNIDELTGIIQIDEKEAIHTARQLARMEGILAGISSGAAVAGALRIATMPEMEGKTVVTLLADTAERYYSTDLFQRPQFT